MNSDNINIVIGEDNEDEGEDEDEDEYDEYDEYDNEISTSFAISQLLEQTFYDRSQFKQVLSEGRRKRFT